MNNHMKPAIVVSNRAFPSSADLIRYVHEKGCGGIDYSFPYHAHKMADLENDIPWVEAIVASGIEIRYHCPFHDVEFAHAQKDKAERSSVFLKECIDFAGRFKGKYITFHTGLGMKSPDELDHETAIINLAELVKYGSEKGVVVCLENLTKGLTKEPDSFVKIITETKAGITFDLGHANASNWASTPNRTGLDFLEFFSDQVINAHVYEIEKIDPETLQAYHVYPHDLRLIEPMLRELLFKKCDWWLIELPKFEEVEHTRVLLKTFLDNCQR